MLKLNTSDKHTTSFQSKEHLPPPLPSLLSVRITAASTPPIVELVKQLSHRTINLIMETDSANEIERS